MTDKPELLWADPVDLDTAIRSIYGFQWDATEEGAKFWADVVQRLRRLKAVAEEEKRKELLRHARAVRNCDSPLGSAGPSVPPHNPNRFRWF